MTFFKMTFFGIFFNISFPIVLEAMYIKFGDPKSIIADFRFYKSKKCFKKGLLKIKKIEKKMFFKKRKIATPYSSQYYDMSYRA